jgi:predicted O-methyltransferase YrrM
MTATNESLTALDALPIAYCDTTRLGYFDRSRIVEALACPRFAQEWSEDLAQLDALKLPQLTGGVNPGDRRALYCMVRQWKPACILEVGTHIGSSTVALALAAARNRLDGIDSRILTVDIRDVNDERTKPWLGAGSQASPRDLLRTLGLDGLVEFRTGSAVGFLSSPGIELDMIFLDGDHGAAAVYREIPLALRNLRNGDCCTVVLHDYFPDMRPMWPHEEALPGPYLAVERFRSEEAGFQALPLGELPWPTKYGTNLTSLAILTRSSSARLPAQAGRVIFVITSEGNDRYSAMTRIALASLRLSNPSLRIMVACDQVSDQAMRHKQDSLLGESDEWLAVDTPDGPADFRNRYVKTKLRSLVKGPYLFLDNDILVRGELHGIFSIGCDVAGALNHSREIFPEQIWEGDQRVLEAMGWSFGHELYINGGVLFFNDTALAHALAEEWHRRWRNSVERTGRHCDQPALNIALLACGPRLAVLEDRLNAQICPSPEVAVDAVLWHFYSSAINAPTTLHEEMVRDLLGGKRLEMNEIRRLIERRHPWNEQGTVTAGLQLAALRAESTVLKHKVAHLEARCHALAATQDELERTRQSLSWRVTSPLRELDRLIRRASKVAAPGATIRTKD